jgi:hypothetical protein
MGVDEPIYKHEELLQKIEELKRAIKVEQAKNLTNNPAEQKLLLDLFAYQKILQKQNLTGGNKRTNKRRKNKRHTMRKKRKIGRRRKCEFC